MLTAELHPYSMNPIAVLLALALSTCAYRIIYLLFFHPLASFPGPRLAAISYWWKALKWRDGTITRELQEMHRTRGWPIIRIGPNHLSFWEPDAYKEIYLTHKFRKYSTFYDAFQTPAEHRTTFTIPEPELHAPRRRQLSALLSRQSVISLERLFHEMLGVFTEKLMVHAKENIPLNFYNAFRCLTVDTVCVFSFGRSAGCLQVDKFEAPSLVAVDKMLSGSYIRANFPGIIRFIELLPRPLQPSWQRAFGDFAQVGAGFLQAYRSAESSPKYPILFDAASHTNNAESTLSDDQLVAEANVLFGAGGDTTGIALSIGCSYIAHDRTVRDRLFDELVAAYSSRHDVLQARWVELEKLPYLSACVYESLRISSPLPGELPRVVGEGGWKFNGVQIPAGTVVSASTVAVNWSERIFTDPQAFKPERWLDSDGEFRGNMENWLVSFGKGQRACIGQTFAMAELYIFLAGFWRLFDVQMEGVGQLEVLDLFTAIPKNHDDMEGRVIATEE
ncbi:cytochrome P450 [Heliocybe sulcata]|uniref:Cytochrome P450 n=1 Tax=Heliocybe sulcata TaxID=5364 RepID=A0A5C3NNU3_9AGAM|nr:cytochrome P450 [Heliocybe sulcata]